MAHRRMQRDKFVCIWLDRQSNQSEDYIYIQKNLQTIFHSFRTFRNASECVDYIVNLKNMKGILITTDGFAEGIIPVIHCCEQIDLIYIVVLKKTIPQSWIQDYSKISGIFHDKQQLTDQIKKDITQSHTDTMSISLISSTDVNSSRDINRQDPSFMYSQLLIEIILNDRKDEKEEETRQDMLDYSRNIYARSPTNLTILDEFEKNFLPELSIYWYTRECFLYRMLNTALWIPEPHVLYKLRYFLRHLHQQIVTQARLQRQTLLPMTVYRGQDISLNQIEQLKRNIGGFLSFNNFLSTSRQRDVALNFLLGFEIGVLFEMKVDPSIERFPFANIEHLSYQQGKQSEEEFLFSMGTVFRIQKVIKENDYYSVQLILSADIDEQLAEYTKQTREDVQSSHSFLSLLKLMHQLSQYNYIEHFIQMFSDDQTLSANSILLGSIHHAFGSIHNDRGQSKEALNHFKKSLNQYLTILPADHPKLSPTYNNVGSAHAAQSNYETALTFFQLAIDCQSNSDNPNKSAIVTYTNNIASIYLQQKQFPQALEYYKHALKLQLEHLGENDPTLTSTYNVISIVYHQLNDPEQAEIYHEKAIKLQENTTRSDPTASISYLLTAGTLCFSQGQYQEALNNFQQALKIQQQYLLPNNPTFSTTFNCIANAYFKQNQFDDALRYHKKALDIEQHCLSHDHTSIGNIYFNISKDYVGLLQWTDALNYGHLAMEQITQKSNDNDSSHLSSILQHLGYIYKQQKDYQEALNYYQRAIDVQNKYFPSDQSTLCSIYNNIANIYSKQKRVEGALMYYKKVLVIEKQLLPDDHLAIAASYMNISKACADLSDWSNALEYGLKAVELMKKSSQVDASTLAPLIQYISHIYFQQKDYQQVIIYSHEALHLSTSYLSDDDPSLLTIYNRLSRAYYKLKKYHEAIPFYRKALTIELKTLSSDDKTIGITYLNLSTAYTSLKQFDEALTTGDQALNQYLKSLPYNHSEVVDLRNYLDSIKIQQMLQAEKRLP